MDCMDSYRSFEIETKETGTDENGNYVIWEQHKQVPCNCHPETCCHFSYKVWRITKFKKYE